MGFWYNFLDILPFSWTEYVFMKNALLAVLIIAPVFGLLGTMIVNNKMSFFSDALGHSALTGIGIGIVAGFANPDIAMVIFAIFFAVVIVHIKHTKRTSMDTVIGVFSSMAVALGVVLVSKGGFNKYSNLLVGDILSITPREIGKLFLMLGIVIVVWILIYKVLMIVSLGETLARSRGVNTELVDMVFTALIAVVVTFSIRWLGMLIINSLFVLPASAARMFAKNMKQYCIASILISLFSGIFGLLLSYYLNTAAGATIALTSGAIYIIGLFIPKN